jgi:hypothetical protein
MEETKYEQKNQMSISLNGTHNNKYQCSEFVNQRNYALRGISQSLNGVRNKSVVRRTPLRGMALIDDDRFQEKAAFQQDPSFSELSSSTIGNRTISVDCAPRRPSRKRELIDEQQLQQHQQQQQHQHQHQHQQQQQSINKQSIINNSTRVLIESMKRSAMSRKLIKQFPSPFSKKQLHCGLSTPSLSSSSSSSKYPSTNKQPVVKAKRYSNQQKNYNAKTQLSAVKHIHSFTTTTIDASIPSEITIIVPATCTSNSVPTISSMRASCDESTYLFPQSDLSIFPTIEAHDGFSISRLLDDDELPLTSSVVFNDVASFSNHTTSSSWLWRVE